jgi:hypothetical protein
LRVYKNQKVIATSKESLIFSGQDIIWEQCGACVSADEGGGKIASFQRYG